MTQQQVLDSLVWLLILIPIGLVIFKQYKAKKSVIQSLSDFNSIREEFENAIADVVAGVIPWLSGFIPAYLSYIHAKEVLGIPMLVAFVLGVVVEGLAFANISTFTEIWQFRREKDGVKKYSKGQVPLWAVLATLGVYLIVVLTVNGLLGFIKEVPLDILYSAVTSGDREVLFVTIAPALVKTFAILLISLLTIPGASTISLRLQHKQFVKDKTAVKKREAKPKQESPKPEPKPEPNVNLTMTPELEKILKFIENMIKSTGTVNKTQLAKVCKLTRPTIYKKLDELDSLGKITYHSDKSVTIP